MSAKIQNASGGFSFASLVLLKLTHMVPSTVLTADREVAWAEHGQKFWRKKKEK